MPMPMPGIGKCGDSDGSGPIFRFLIPVRLVMSSKLDKLTECIIS